MKIIKEKERILPMKKLKKSISLLFVFAMVISMFTVQPLGVSAAEKPSVDLGKECYYYFPPMTGSYGKMINGLKKNAKVTVKSSNKKVVSVKYDKTMKMVCISPKKIGKAVITCKIKQNGKTYTSKGTYTVLKYKNPFAKCKIGSKDYTKKFDKYNSCAVKMSKKTQKLQIKMKKGYKITEIKGIKNSDASEVKIKNGSKIKTSDYMYIFCSFKDKKGNITDVQFGMY